jgi:cysteinyl-tRNA synthetase
MHKSLGNFVTVHELLEKENPNVVRLLMLGSHYRSGLNFTEEKLEEARKAYGRMAEVVSRLNFLSRQAPKEAPHSPDLSVLERALYETRPAFEEAMDDDFNTARALSTIFELIRLVNSLTQSSEFVLTSRAREVLTQARELIMELGGVLGLKFEEGRAVDQNRLSALVDLLLEIREEARSKRDWQLADRIRDGLSRQGIMVEDRPDGPIWKIKSDVEHFSTR